MSYDSWKTLNPHDRGHEEDCVCEECHSRHVDNGLVLKFARLPDYACCEREKLKWVQQGEWCAKCDSGSYMKEFKCWNCSVSENPGGE